MREHLNRAIILEREAAEKYGWEEVCVVPRPHAGGSWATTCWKNFKDPVAVEEIRANAGMDIGGHPDRDASEAGGSAGAAEP